MPVSDAANRYEKETSENTKRNGGAHEPGAAHVRNGPSGRRRPTQQRSRFTVSTILQAAAEVIAAEGFDRASTNRIATRAGVSIGSLYQYFANKQAILAALLEAHRSEVHEVVECALDRLEDPSTSIADELVRMFEGLYALHREDPNLTRVLSEEVPKTKDSSEPDDHDQELVGRVVAVFTARPEITVSNPAIAAIVLGQTVEALTKWLSHSAPPSLDPAVFIDESVRMLTGYLTSKTAPDT